MGMNMDDLEGMGIRFNEETNTISICEDGQEKIRVQLPEGADLEEVMEALVDQMSLSRMSGAEACAQVRDDIDLVDDALIDMIENDDRESDEAAVHALGAATKNIVLLMSSVCENEQEEEYVAQSIINPLGVISKELLLSATGAKELSRDEMMLIASDWLPIRAAVEGILEEIE